jgi:hypothetical protein
MKVSLRSAVLIALLCGSGLAACSPQETSAAGPTDDPCALVSKSQVREVFPGADSGKRDHSTDQYGVASCKWELPTSTLAAQTYKSTNSASDELRGRMLGSLDPLQPALREKIQYDPVAGLGDEAAVVAVKADQANGVLADSAMLGIRRGERMTILFTSALVDGDVAATKKALETLGRSAAPRL